MNLILSLFLTFSFSVVAFAADESETATVIPETAAVVQEKAEDQIPVDFNKSKKSEASESSSGRMILSFGLLACVLGVGYYFAKKHGKPANSQQTKIKILSQHYLGPKKSLAIVRVAGESVLIGITDHSINMIKSLSLLDDEIPEASPTDFQATFNEKKDMDFPQNQVKAESSEEFSIKHIKDAVSLKLKGMRNDL